MGAGEGGGNGAVAQHFFLMLCASRDRRGVVGRMDTWLYMAESLRCSPETTVTFLSAVPQYKIKSLKFGGGKEKIETFSCD